MDYSDVLLMMHGEGGYDSDGVHDSRNKDYWGMCIESTSDEESEQNMEHEYYCESSMDESEASTLWQLRANHGDEAAPAQLCECAGQPKPADLDVWETIVEQAHVESMHADELNFENMMTSSHLCCADLLNRRIENRVVTLLDEEIAVPLRLDKFSAANRARLPELHSRVCATVSRHSMGGFSIDGCTRADAQSAKIDVLAQMVTRELQHVALVFHTGNPVVTVNTQRYDLEVGYDAAASSGASAPNARQKASIMTWLRLALLGRVLHHLLSDGDGGMLYGDGVDDVLSYVPLIDGEGGVLSGTPRMLCQKNFAILIPSFGVVIEIPEDSDGHLSVILVFHQPCLDACIANLKELDSMVDGERTMEELMQANAQRFVSLVWHEDLASCPPCAAVR